MEITKRCTEIPNMNKIMEEEIQQQEQQLRELVNDHNQTDQNSNQINKVAVTIEQDLKMASQSDLWL